MTQYGTPTNQPVWPPATPKKRSGVKWIVLGAVLGVLLLCGIGSAIVAASDQQQTTGNSPVEYAPTAEPATEPTTGPTADTATKAPAKTAAPAKAKPTWKTVVTLKGSADKRSAPFKLSGAQTRLTYQIKGGKYATALIYVMERGTSLQEDGGFPEVMVDAAGKDTTELVKDAGDYYLDVKAANCTWTVTIQELR